MNYNNLGDNFRLDEFRQPNVAPSAKATSFDGRTKFLPGAVPRGERGHWFRSTPAGASEGSEGRWGRLCRSRDLLATWASASVRTAAGKSLGSEASGTGSESRVLDYARRDPGQFPPPPVLRCPVLSRSTHAPPGEVVKATRADMHVGLRTVTGTERV